MRWRWVLWRTTEKGNDSLCNFLLFEVSSLHTIAHNRNRTQSHTIAHNRTQSHTIAHNCTQLHTIAQSHTLHITNLSDLKMMSYLNWQSIWRHWWRHHGCHAITVMVRRHLPHETRHYTVVRWWDGEMVRWWDGEMENNFKNKRKRNKKEIKKKLKRN
jgi:hypothetical protein